MTDTSGELVTIDSKSKLKTLKLRRSSIKGDIPKFKKYLSEVSYKIELTNIENADLSLNLTLNVKVARCR